MYQMNYLVPPGYPVPHGSYDKDIVNMTASMKGVDRKSVNVPNSALWIQLKVMLDGASFEIKKRKELVYINFFCFEADKIDSVFSTVQFFYEKYKLGTPKRPSLPTWIHSIPADYHLLQENEIQLCQKMTVSYYWALYTQLLKKRNILN